jgi:hypothetical protein
VVGSGEKAGRSEAVGEGETPPTATFVGVAFGLGKTAVALPLTMFVSRTSTSTARTATAPKASHSRRASLGRVRPWAPRGATPVRRSAPANRGSDLAMGSAGYSRTDNKAFGPP